MKNKKNILLISFILLIILTCFFIYTKNNNKIETEENSIKFFEQMISVENFKLFISNDNKKLTDNFKEYCNDRGISVLFGNRIVSYNYNYILKYDIQSYENLKVELIKESADGKETYKDYKITYTYIDINNKKYELCDYYTLNFIDDKIDYIKLNLNESTVGKEMNIK